MADNSTWNVTTAYLIVQLINCHNHNLLAEWLYKRTSHIFHRDPNMTSLSHTISKQHIYCKLFSQIVIYTMSDYTWKGSCFCCVITLLSRLPILSSTKLWGLYKSQSHTKSAQLENNLILNSVNQWLRMYIHMLAAFSSLLLASAIVQGKLQCILIR